MQTQENHKKIIVPMFGCIIRFFMSFDDAQEFYGVDMQSPGCVAYVRTLENKTEGREEIAICISNPDCFDEDTLSHECVHAAWRVLGRVGIRVTEHNHEALAYVVGFLMGELYKWGYDAWEAQKEKSPATAETVTA